MTAEERETVVQMDDASATASVWTAQRRVAGALRRRGFQPKETLREGGREVAWLFDIPVTSVRFVRPRKSIPKPQNSA